MKTKITKLILSLCFSLLVFSTQAQLKNGFCGTMSVQNKIAQLRAPADVNHATCGRSFDEELCFKIKVHIVHNSGGITITNAMAQEQVSILNSKFNPHGMSFDWDGTIESVIYNVPVSINDQTIFTINNDPNAIDIYLSNTYHSSFANGVAESSELVIQRGHIVNPDDGMPTPVIAHEMGHIFGLFHTHHGQPIAGENNGDNMACVEFPTGLYNVGNACACGDYVEDTPGDSGLMSFGPSAPHCYYPGGDEYLNTGVFFEPDTRNIMAYTGFSCMQHFTEGQANRMKNFVLYEPLSHLTAALCDATPPISCSTCDLSAAFNALLQNNLTMNDCNQWTFNVPFLLPGCGAGQLFIDWGTGGIGSVQAIQPNSTYNYTYTSDGNYQIKLYVNIDGEQCTPTGRNIQVNCGAGCASCLVASNQVLGSITNTGNCQDFNITVTPNQASCYNFTYSTTYNSTQVPLSAGTTSINMPFAGFGSIALYTYDLNGTACNYNKVSVNTLCLTNGGEDSYVYPNPYNNGETLRIANVAKESLLSVEVLDMTGNVIQKLQPNTSFKLNNLKTGLYWVRYTTAKKVEIKRLIVN